MAFFVVPCVLGVLSQKAVSLGRESQSVCVCVCVVRWTRGQYDV